MHDHPALPKKTSTTKSKATATSALENKTRKHCIEQFEKMFTSIFAAAAAAASPGRETVKIERAREFAELVEGDLFANFSEIDVASGKGERAPKQKYLAKFRALHFNLKSNEYFRSRIANDTLNARAIVNMAHENLLTPEARAEQEAIKERSLAQSVKTATVVPKTRMTHKGEEVIDEFDPAMMKDQKNRAEQSNKRQVDMDEPGENAVEEGDSIFSVNIDPNERLGSMSITGFGMSPKLDVAPAFGSPPAMSPVTAGSPSQRAFSPVEVRASAHSRQNSTTFAVPPSADRFVAPLTSPESPVSSVVSDHRPALPHSRSDSISRARLDLDLVWGAYKSPTIGSSASPSKEDELDRKPKARDDEKMDEESDENIANRPSPEKVAIEEEQDMHEREDYDPFAEKGKSTADDDFDAIMNPSDETVAKPEPDLLPKNEEESLDKIAALPSVWEGAVIHPEEGGFPARLVQVGGTILGAHPQIWEHILPQGTLTISGRIDVKKASEYLVQSRFANSREVIVLAHLPNGEVGSVTETVTASKPNMEKAIARHQHLVSFFSEKQRFGVCPPEDDLKRRTKDHYVVALKKDDPLPDFIELLDEHAIGETGSRSKDLLLSVLVLQKSMSVTSSNTSLKPGNSIPSAQNFSPRRDQPTAVQPVQQSMQDSASPLQRQMQSSISPSIQPGQTFTQGLPHPHQVHQAPQQTPLPQQQQEVPQSAMQPGLPALDPAALQSLLSNPALLQVLNNSQHLPQQQQRQHGVFPHQDHQSFNTNGHSFTGQMPQNLNQWQRQPSLHQPNNSGISGPLNGNQWNPAGSPLWQGGPPMRQNQPEGFKTAVRTGNQSPPSNVGYVHPDRIRQVSIEARNLGVQGERGENRGRSGNRRDNRNSVGRYGSEGESSRYLEERNRGFDRERGRRGDHRERDESKNGPRSRGDKDGGRSRDGSTTSNQMAAGIQDRGWGRRSG